jgi:hypothetical protein
MKLSNLLNENKVDEFKSRFSSKFPQENLNKIVSSIPSEFLLWVGNMIDNINFDENLSKVTAAIKSFEKISSSLPKTDINQYQNINELVTEISKYLNKMNRDYEQVSGGNVVYNDDRFFVVNPQTHDASCYYGQGTRWCSSSGDDFYFHKFNDDGKLFYILDRTKNPTDPEYKVALSRKFDGKLSFYNSNDTSIKSGWIFTDPIYTQIMDSIETYMNDVYSEQIELYKNEESRRKEQERVRKVQIQRQLASQRREAQVRRENREWDLNDDCPSEGIRAHAVLRYLVENEGAEVLDESDIKYINDLQRQILEMGDNPDFEDEVQELRDEIESIMDGKIDVYDIMPSGSYYEMTEFEVIGGDLYNQRYAAGDEMETSSSAIQSIKNLIDDVGFDGFNKSFVESHIDEDKVKDLIERFYEDDIRDNPEYYVDDEHRQLSSEQEDIIASFNRRIRKVENEIDFYQSLLEENEYTEDVVSKIEVRIEKLSELIDEYQSVIKDQEDSPEGDYDEDAIQEALDDVVYERAQDPLGFLKEYGFEMNDYVDEENLIDDIISSDGYGHTLGTYDGNLEEYKIGDEWISVVRID